MSDKPGNGNGNGHHIQMPMPAAPAPAAKLTEQQKIVVTICEDLLKLARAGQINDLAFTATYSSNPTGQMVSGRSPHYDDVRLIGHLELMKDGAIRRIRAGQA